MLTVGLDAHERTSSICILDGDGQVVKEKAIQGHPTRMLAYLRRLKEPFQICFEASTNYGWLHDELQDVARKVFVAHPRRLRLIFRSRRKNDRIDALRLAELEMPTAIVNEDGDSNTTHVAGSLKSDAE